MADSLKETPVSAAAAENDTPPAKRLQFLDALRGGASLAVVAHHAYIAWSPTQGTVIDPHGPLSWLAWILRLGFGVDIFFVLSGLCMMYVLLPRHIHQNERLDVLAFYRKRFLRIVPLYYGAVCLFAGITLARSVPSGQAGMVLTNTGRDLATHLFLVHNIFPATLLTLNESFWSLAVVWQWYLVFPLVLLAVQRWGIRSVCLGSILLMAFWSRGMESLLPFLPSSMTDVVWVGLPVRQVEILIGVTTAFLLRNPRPHQGRYATVLALACGTASHFLPRYLPLEAWHCTLRGLCIAGVILALFDLTARFPILLRGLKPFAPLGLLSYPVYLLHQPLLNMTRAQVLTWGLSQPMKAFLFLLVGVPTIYLIGLGYQRLFDRIADSLRAARARARTALPRQHLLKEY